MLQLSTSFQSVPIMSLRTGGEVAHTTSHIINPNNLKIEGFYCELDKKQLVLLIQDVRDLLPQGLVIDDTEVLSEPDELVRLREVLQLGFQLTGKPVVTASKEKVGKVTDYALETTTFYIQKLYVGQSLLKSISSGQLSIDRTQIVEITPKKIVIQEILKGHKGAVPAGAPAS
jgi:sporulation protein YlmC with PRC-barrel domain